MGIGRIVQRADRRIDQGRGPFGQFQRAVQIARHRRLGDASRCRNILKIGQASPLKLIKRFSKLVYKTDDAVAILVCKDNFERSSYVAGFFSSARCASRSSPSCTPCPVHVLVAMRHSGDAVCPCGPCVNLRVTGAIRWTACFRTWSGSCRARCGISPGRKWWSCTRSDALSASDATDLHHDDNTFVRHRVTARQPCQPRHAQGVTACRTPP